MRFFFYGTLMDADVRRAVLVGRAPAAEPATLAGWRRVPVLGQPYPILLRDRDAEVTGVLVRGLDRAASGRLEAYEGSDYRAIDVSIAAGGRQVAARMFVPNGRQLKPRPGTWSFETWRQRHKRDALAAILRRGASVVGG